MLFTELTKIDRAELMERLESTLRARGIDPAILRETVGQDVPVEELLLDVIEDAIGEAADANRESFRQRQRKGIQDAMSRGTPIGRPTRKNEKTFEEVRALYEDRQLTGAEAAKRLRVARGTFYRWMKEANELAAAERQAKRKG